MFEEEVVRGEGAEWVKKLADRLRKAGIDFEYEGESLRFHLDDLVVEVTTHPEGGFMVSIQVPLPGPSEEYSDSHVKTYEKAVKLFTRLSGEAQYELDTSLPDYPMLHLVRRYTDPWKMVEDVANAIS